MYIVLLVLLHALRVSYHSLLCALSNIYVFQVVLFV